MSVSIELPLPSCLELKQHDLCYNLRVSLGLEAALALVHSEASLPLLLSVSSKVTFVNKYHQEYFFHGAS